MQLMSMDLILEKFELENIQENFGLKFDEYQLLYAIKQGIELKKLYFDLRWSPAKMTRVKKRIVVKMSATSFEQAILQAHQKRII